MKTLVVTITTIQDTDFAGLPITIKQATGAINDISTKIISSFPDSNTDQQCIDAYKTELTSQGFTWDN